MADNQENDHNPEKPQKGFRRVLRWFGRFTLGLFIFLAFLPMVFVAAWQFGPVRSGIKGIGLPIAKNFLYGKIELDELGGNLVSSIELKGVRWYRCKGTPKKGCPTGPLMAGLEHLRVRYDLLYFLRTGVLFVKEVYLVRPQGYLGLTRRIGPLGKRKTSVDLVQHIASSPSKKKPKKKSTGETNFNLRVETVKIVDLKGSFSLGPKKRTYALEKFNFVADYVLSVNGLKMHSNVKRMRFKATKPKAVVKNLSMFFWMKGDELGVKRLRLDIPRGQYQTHRNSKPYSAKDFSLVTNYYLNLKTLRMRSEIKSLKVKGVHPRVTVPYLGLSFWMDVMDNRLGVNNFFVCLGEGKKLVTDSFGLSSCVGTGSELSFNTTLTFRKSLGIKLDATRFYLHPKDLRRAYPNIPLRVPASGTLNVDGSLSALDLNLKAKVGKADLSLVTKKTDVMAEAYDVDLKLKNANLRKLLGNNEWDSRLSLRLRAKGKGFSASSEGKVVLNVWRGYFQKYRFDRIRIDALTQKGIAKVRRFQIRTGFGKFSGYANVNYWLGKFRGYLFGDVRNLKPVGSLLGLQMRGAGRLKLWARGNRWVPKVRANLQLRKFKYFRSSYRSLLSKSRYYRRRAQQFKQKWVQARIRQGKSRVSRRCRRIYRKYNRSRPKCRERGSRRKQKGNSPSSEAMLLTCYEHDLSFANLYKSKAKPLVEIRRASVKARLGSLFPLSVRVDMKGRGIRSAGIRVRRMRLKAPVRLDFKSQTLTTRPEIFGFDVGTGYLELERKARVRLHRWSEVLLKNFWLRHRSQRVRLDGWFNWSRWSHRIRMRVSNMPLGRLRRALGVMPTVRLFGLASLDLTAQGSFARPRLRVQVHLKNGQYQKFRRLNVWLGLRYRWRKSRDRKLHFDLKVDQVRRRMLTMDWDVPVKLNLLKVAFRQDFRRLLYLKRRLNFSLDLTDLDLAWLGRNLDLPQIRGFLKAKLRFTGSFHDPKLQLQLSMKEGGWGRYRPFTSSLFLSYQAGVLSFSRRNPKTQVKEDTRLFLEGKKMLVLGGQLPLELRVIEQCGMPVLMHQMTNQSMSFSANIVKQRLGWLMEQLLPSLPPRLAYLDGLLSGSLVLRGKPSAPKIRLNIKLEKGSFCPLIKDGFACEEDVGFDVRGEYAFRKNRDITLTLSRPNNLRARGLQFSFDSQYHPPKGAQKSGRFLYNTRLALGKRVLLAIGKYAKPKRKCKFGSRPMLSGPGPAEFAANLSIHPKSLKPTFRLFDPVRLSMQIPEIKLQALSQWVRIPLLKRFRGLISLDFSVCNRLSNPDLKMLFKLKNLSYETGTSADGKPAFLDRLGYELNFTLREGNLGWYMKAWALGKRLFDSTALIRNAKIGIDPKTFTLLRRRQGTYVYGNLRIPGFDLSRLANRIGMPDKIHGILRGNIEIGGDPACPLLGKPTLGRQARNHLSISNGYFGIPRALYKQLRKKKVPSNEIAALKFKKLQVSMHSISQGRVKLNMNMWKYRDPFIVRRNGRKILMQPDVFKGEIRWPLPLSLFPYSAKSLVRQKRCLHWPGGRPFPKIKVLLVQNEDLSLRFLESFLSGFRLDAILSATIDVEGDMNSIRKVQGSLSLGIRKIQMKKYGIQLLSNLHDRKMRKGSFEKWRKCQSIKNSNTRNKKTGVLDRHIPGCILSYLKISLSPKFYQLEGRLQGSRGRPLSLYGKIPQVNFRLDTAPPRRCLNSKSSSYYSVKCTRLRSMYQKRKVTLFLRSKDFRPMATLRHKLNMDMNVSVSKAWNTPLKVLGKVIVPSMLFTLPETSRKPGNYDDHKDMVVLGERSELRLRPKQTLVLKPEPKKTKKKKKPLLRRRKSERNNLLVDLKIVIPRGVRVRNRDFDMTARTEEFRDLHVTLRGDSLRLVGGAEVVRGDLTFYTRTFKVQPGSRITFMGQSLGLDELGQLNARLAITAIYSLNMSKGSSLEKQGHSRINVVLIVTGTVQKPKIALKVQNASSLVQIPMDPANVLTLILTGTTTDDLAGGDRSGLSNQALGAFSKFASAQLRDQISQVLPIDVFKFETGARAEDLKIEIGKYFTKWLYGQVLYKPVPLEEEDLWEVLLDVAITRRWSLEVRFGQRKRNNAFLFRNTTHFFFQIKR